MNIIPWPVYQIREGKPQTFPLVLARVSEGFPLPADDYIELKIDLNQLLVTKPHATFFVKVQGNSMEGARIKEGDLLIVVRYERARPGKVVIGYFNGEFTVKRLGEHEGQLCLMPENPDYEPIILRKDMEFEVWGVVHRVIHEP